MSNVPSREITLVPIHLLSISASLSDSNLLFVFNVSLLSPNFHVLHSKLTFLHRVYPYILNLILKNVAQVD